METQEKLIDVATRIKGDNWQVNGTNKIQPTLTDALETWFQKATLKPKAFRLDLIQGKLYAIIDIDYQEPEPKKYSIYGDE